MIDRKKVVPLNSQIKSQAVEQSMDETHLLARLPAPFAEMKAKGKQALKPLLQALFDNIDDALFELADRAEDNAEQNMYFESMREVRIKRRGMELGFGREIDNAFLQILSKQGEPPLLSNADEVSIDGLSLVQEEELEELVAADSMVTKASGQFGSQISQLTTRLDTLIENQEVSASNNPFGPRSICQSFVIVCRDLDLDIKAKLVLFKLFDRYVMAQLESLYRDCNQVLISSGILPTLGHKHKGKRRSIAPDSNSNASPESPNHQESIETEAVFTDLQNLLHASSFSQLQQPAQSVASVSSGLASPGQAPMIPREQLMRLLQNVQQSLVHQLEQQQQTALSQGVAPAQLDIQGSLNHLLATKMPSKPMSIGQVDDDTINLVAMLFQFILDDRNLAAAMKAMIARLQIPIIKVAMQDKTFFSKGGHPARKLLNEIAQASLGWVPSNNIERDPLYKKVTESVNLIVNEFENDTSIFQDVLTDFMAFLETEQRRAHLVEKRTLTAEDGKATSELARSTVQEALNERVAGKALPKTVITLLEQGWSNVLFLICLKEGTEHKSWIDALQIVDDLVWSVESIETVEQRQRLMQLIPSLLKNLRNGLTKIGYNPIESERLFTDLEKIHLSQMQEPKPSNMAKAQKPIAEKTLDQLLEERSNGSVSLEDLDAALDQQLGTLEESSQTQQTSDVERKVVEKLLINGSAQEPVDEVVELADDDPCLQQVDAMSMGTWVELHQENDKKFRARLAAVIRGTGKYIFVNRAGMKVAEYTRVRLGQSLKQGLVSLLDEGQLFDRALESVIGNLRDMRKSG